MLDPSEADTVEELAEIAVAFLEIEIGASRCSVVHGDEQHQHPAIQGLGGFSVGELSLLDEIQWGWESQLTRPGVLEVGPSDLRGRHGLLVGLHNRDGHYLGLLHADQDMPFGSSQQLALLDFSQHYARQLERLSHLPAVVEVPTQVSIPSDTREWTWMDYY